MAITTALLIVQWNLAAVQPIVYLWSLFMAVSVAIIAHNHNHVPIWRSRLLNIATDYWLTLFYGFPAFGWIPTHNKNHHFLNNKEGDYTITYRVSEKNNILTLLSYPSISSYFQQAPIAGYLRTLFYPRASCMTTCREPAWPRLGTPSRVCCCLDRWRSTDRALPTCTKRSSQ